MSAPRKIWAAPSTSRGWNFAFCSDDTPEDAKDRCDLYHHDDVVRELVEALETISGRHIPDQPAAYGGDELEWAQRQHTELRLIARAALAKIAQEGR